MHRRQGCLVACIRMESSVHKGLWMDQTEPNVVPNYWTHRAQSPDYQCQDAILMYLTQATFLLMYLCACQTRHSLFILSQQQIVRKIENTMVFVACQPGPNKYLLNNSVRQNKVRIPFDPEVLPYATQRISQTAL